MKVYVVTYHSCIGVFQNQKDAITKFIDFFNSRSPNNYDYFGTPLDMACQYGQAYFDVDDCLELTEEEVQ